jgi:hypothetical protein
MKKKLFKEGKNYFESLNHLDKGKLVNIHFKSLDDLNEQESIKDV